VHALGAATGGVALDRGADRLLLGTIGVAMRLDRAWKIVRRAAGHEQKRGMLERIFVISVMIGATTFFIWLFVIHGPCPEVSPYQ
jgi:hypothetical protein